MTAHYTKCTPRKKTEFLRRLRQCGLVNKSADLCRLSRSVLYQHKRKSEKFAKKWDQAVDESVDSVLIEEARRRAVDGIRKPLTHLGEFTKDAEGNINYIREYSDSLLMFLIKAKRPEYRQSALFGGHTGDGPQTVTFTMVLSE